MSDLAARLAEVLDRAEQAPSSINLATDWYTPGDLTRSHHEGGAGLPDFDEAHIVAWSPQRVLALVRRDRALLAAHASANRNVQDHVARCGPAACGHRDYVAATTQLQTLTTAVQVAARFWLPGEPADVSMSQTSRHDPQAVARA